MVCARPISDNRVCAAGSDLHVRRCVLPSQDAHRYTVTSRAADFSAARTPQNHQRESAVLLIRSSSLAPMQPFPVTLLYLTSPVRLI